MVFNVAMLTVAAIMWMLVGWRMYMDRRYFKDSKKLAHAVMLRTAALVPVNPQRASALWERRTNFHSAAGMNAYREAGRWFGDPRRSMAGWQRYLLGERSGYVPEFSKQLLQRKPGKLWGATGCKGRYVSRVGDHIIVERNSQYYFFDRRKPDKLFVHL